MSDEVLKTSVLTDAHRAAGGRMVAFAGYEMPVQYPAGILKEHLWTREHAGAFDVSHMGPAFLDLIARSHDGEANHAAVAALIEPIVSGDIAGLKPGQLRYTLLLDENGGILDDLMIGRPINPFSQGRLYIVVNAGCKEADFALIAQAAGEGAVLSRADDRALIALQGPEAASVLSALLPQAADLTFMTYMRTVFEGADIRISRSGYTGEDGFELLVPAAVAPRFWQRLLDDDRVRPIGLGARDSLRLEAGLPLYGHDLDKSVSPIEAALGFAVSKKRLKAGTVRGAGRMAAELAGGLTRVRVGLRILEGAPAREGAEIAMGFVPPALSNPGTRLTVLVRGRAQTAEVVALPFVPHRYRRPSKPPA